MLFRTHLVFSLLFVFCIIGLVENKILFFVFSIIGFIAPDLDTKNSKFGRKIFFRPFQFFLKHRGFAHSLTFGFLISLGLSLILPIFGLGFFTGFSSHILGDSFTKEGVAAFWPLRKRTYGFIQTGSFTENIVFYSLVFIDTILFVFLIIKSFSLPFFH